MNNQAIVIESTDLVKTKKADRKQRLLPQSFPVMAYLVAFKNIIYNPHALDL